MWTGKVPECGGNPIAEMHYHSRLVAADHYTAAIGDPWQKKAPPGGGAFGMNVGIKNKFMFHFSHNSFRGDIYHSSPYSCNLRNNRILALNIYCP